MRIEDTVFVYRISGGDRLSWHGRYHAHGANEYEIHFFLEGSGSFLCNKTRYPVSAGKLFLAGPRDFHSIIPDAIADPLTYYAILFSLDADAGNGDDRLYSVLETCLSERRTVLSIDTNFRFQFEDILLMNRSQESSLQDSARYLLSSFLFRWFGRSQSLGSENKEAEIPDSFDGQLQTTANAPGGKHPEVNRNRMHVEKALALMTKSVRENIKIEDIAWKIGLSDEHFIRIFRNEMRMTPHQYFLRLKVEGASALLMSTGKSVGEISDWFGFGNQFHFSRIFKKCTGMSPLAYRRTYLQTVDFI